MTIPRPCSLPSMKNATVKDQIYVLPEKWTTMRRGGDEGKIFVTYPILSEKESRYCTRFLWLSLDNNSTSWATSCRSLGLAKKTREIK